MCRTHLSYAEAASASCLHRELLPLAFRGRIAVTPSMAASDLSEKHVPRVLVVDDDIELLGEIGDLMCLWGYHTITFSSPCAVLRYLGDKNCDVLLSDVDMPEMSGWRLADQVADLHPSVRIGLMSGRIYPDNVRDFRWPLFPKPFEINILKRFIETSGSYVTQPANR